MTRMLNNHHHQHYYQHREMGNTRKKKKKKKNVQEVKVMQLHITKKKIIIKNVQIQC